MQFNTYLRPNKSLKFGLIGPTTAGKQTELCWDQPEFKSNFRYTEQKAACVFCENTVRSLNDYVKQTLMALKKKKQSV